MVPPFARDTLASLQDPAVHDDTAARAGSENDAEYGLRSSRRAIRCFGERETVGVVGYPDRTVQHALEIAIEGASDQPCGVRVLDESGKWGQRSRYPNADGALRTELGFDRHHEVTYGRYRRVVVGAGRRHAPPKQFGFAINGDRLDLRSAEIDTYAHYDTASRSKSSRSSGSAIASAMFPSASRGHSVSGRSRVSSMPFPSGSA